MTERKIIYVSLIILFPFLAFVFAIPHSAIGQVWWNCRYSVVFLQHICNASTKAL